MKTKVKNIRSFLSLSLREKRSNLKVLGGGFLLLLLFSCTEENYITLPQPNKGKVNVYIEGSITNAEAQAKLDEEVGTITENIYVQNTTQLTDITIKPIRNMRDIVINNNPNLKNITIQGVSNKINEFRIYDGHYLNKILIKGIVEANKLNFGHMASDYNLYEFIDVECHDLVTINGDLRLFIGQYNHPVFNKLNFYDLKYINHNPTISSSSSSTSYCRWQGNYSEFNLPKLEEVYNLEHYVHVQNVTYPMLKKGNNIKFSYAPQNLNLNLPLLEEVNSITGGAYNLSISFPNLMNCNYLELSGWFSSDKINEILNQFVSVQPISGKTIDLDDSYNNPPTGQGLIDKQTLINQGNTVLTN